MWGTLPPIQRKKTTTMIPFFKISQVFFLFREPVEFEMHVVTFGMLCTENMQKKTWKTSLILRDTFSKLCWRFEFFDVLSKKMAYNSYFFWFLFVCYRKEFSFFWSMWNKCGQLKPKNKQNKITEWKKRRKLPNRALKKKKKDETRSKCFFFLKLFFWSKLTNFFSMWNNFSKRK